MDKVKEAKERAAQRQAEAKAASEQRKKEREEKRAEKAVADAEAKLSAQAKKDMVTRLNEIYKLHQYPKYVEPGEEGLKWDDAVDNLPTACEALKNPEISTTERLLISSAIGSLMPGVYQDVQSNGPKIAKHASSLLSAVLYALTTPDEGDGTGVSDEGESLHSFLDPVSKMVGSTCSAQNMFPHFLVALVEFWHGVIAAQDQIKLNDPDAAKKRLIGKAKKAAPPSNFRTDAITTLVKVVPMMPGALEPSNFPPDVFPYLSQLVACMFDLLAFIDLPDVKDQITRGLQPIALHSKELLLPHTAKILGAIRNGSTSFLNLIRDPQFMQHDPDAFVQNLDVIMQLPFRENHAIVMAVSGSPQRDALVPFSDKIVEYAVSDPQMSAFAFSIIKSLVGSPAGQEAFAPAIDQLYNRSFQLRGTTALCVNIMGAVGKKDPQTADRMVEMLVGMLQDPRIDPTTPVLIIVELRGLGDNVSNKEAVIGPHLDLIRSYSNHTNCVQLVQTFEDWYFGRSLEKVEIRLDNLEEVIAELNGKVYETCTNFEEVKAYVDQNMREMKEFMATVAKRLPQPQKLGIEGKLRKHVRLTFICPRSQQEFELVTSDWSKWLKIGFSAIKLSTCVIDLGMGNPLGIAKKGVDAVKEIYSAYKAKDDKDFNTYIRQPFLTSAEQDKLIEQLRKKNFFDTFFYDAQTGEWCHNSTMSDVESEKKVAEKAAQDATAKNIVKKGGTGLDVASALDLGKEVLNSAGLTPDEAALGVGVSQDTLDKAYQMNDAYGQAKEVASTVSTVSNAVGKQVNKAMSETAEPTAPAPKETSKPVQSSPKPQQSATAAKPAQKPAPAPKPEETNAPPAKPQSTAASSTERGSVQVSVLESDTLQRTLGTPQTVPPVASNLFGSDEAMQQFADALSNQITTQVTQALREEIDALAHRITRMEKDLGDCMQSQTTQKKTTRSLFGRR